MAIESFTLMDSDRELEIIDKLTKIKDNLGRTKYFSRGILATSLYALGLDDKKAYDIAKEIEDEIFELNQSISKNDLVQLTLNKVSKVDSKIAERYRISIREEVYKPIIILLAGVPGIGKSTIATDLCVKLEISNIIGTDMIREILRQTISFKLVPELHCSSYEAYKYLKPQISPILRKSIVGYEEQSRHITVGVEAVIQVALNSRDNSIIEGVHLSPNILDPSIISNPHVLMIFLYLEDKDEHMKRFHKRGASVKNRQAERYTESFEDIRTIQSFLLEEAVKYDIPTIETNNFRQTIDKTTELVWDRIFSLVKDKK